MQDKTRPLRKATTLAFVALIATLPTASAWIGEPIAPASEPPAIFVRQTDGQNVTFTAVPAPGIATWTVKDASGGPSEEPQERHRAILVPAPTPAGDGWTYTFVLGEPTADAPSPGQVTVRFTPLEPATS